MFVGTWVVFIYSKCVGNRPLTLPSARVVSPQLPSGPRWCAWVLQCI
jgi:hypothetical protein